MTALTKTGTALAGGLIALLLLTASALTTLLGTGPGTDLNPANSAMPLPSRYALTDIPPRMLTLYQQAAPQCPGLPWTVLAAIGKVETNHARHPTMISTAGAVGPMQFLPATFRTYAHPVPPGGKNPPTPWDPVDAIHAAARLLCANGAKNSNLNRAIWHYNHSTAYIHLVLTTAKKYTATTPTTPSEQAVWPVDSRHISADYHTPGPWASGRHTGIDFPVPPGTAVHAAWTATVTKAGPQGHYGNAVLLRHPDHTYTLYAHLHRATVRPGQTLTTGQTLGTSGATGNTTGPHLHFETRTTPHYGTDTNPLTWLTTHGAPPP